MFKARDMNSYAEPVLDEELQEAAGYFLVNFVDEAMLIPTMATVVYIGRDLELEDDDQVYFQDIESFRRGVRYDDVDGHDLAIFHSGSRNELGHVFDFEHALDQLLACALRRRKSPEACDAE